MPKIARELTAVEVNRLMKPGFHAVGGVPGLLLQVTDTGSRSWALRTVVGGKRRYMGLGGFPAVTLAQAKGKAREARAEIEAGIDPIATRREVRSAMLADAASARTFAQCVEAYLDAKGDEWRNGKHRQQWRNTLETYAFPVIGEMLVRDVGLPQVLRVLEPIWKTKTETATRVRGRIESVLDWATVRGYRHGDNPARWRGHLETLLGNPRKIRKVEHHRALPADDVPPFMAKLRQKAGIGARALELLVLTAARSGEVRGARWGEFDLDKAEWVVPGERMKAGKTHRVPLSAPAVKLLKALPRIDGTDLVFPSVRNTPLSDMTLAKALRDMRVDAVPHGFRSSFKYWASERTNYPNEVSEMALAHVIENKVEAAYRRGELFEKRRKLMSDWAAFIGQPVKEGGKVGARVGAKRVAT